MRWRFHSRFSSNVTPRYLAFLLHVLIFWLLILKLRCSVICLFFGRKMIISVLLPFRFILFAQSQWHIKERSWFTCLLIFLSELSVNSKFMSSTYIVMYFTIFNWIVHDVDEEDKNKRGPSTEPCVTQYEILFLKMIHFLWSK